MNYKLKKLITNWRMWILVATLLISVIAINPNPGIKGVAIRAVEPNSSASIAGVSVSKDTVLPKNREIITAVDKKEITSLADYNKVVSSLKPNSTITIKTGKRSYTLKTPELGVAGLGITVSSAPKTNIRKGLDLQGGTRVLLQPEKKMDSYDIGVLLDNMKERLNVYGLSDIVVREAGDLSGNQFIVVEIAGATESEIKELLAKQGKFEAKISNKTVFRGGKDITFVCRSADCSGIDPQKGCSSAGGQWGCAFRFEIALSQDAAHMQANATKDLQIVDGADGRILSEQIEFYLDDTLVNTLNIGAELKGEPSTRIHITGFGIGGNEQAAAFNALQNMKRLQTILITGSLPVKLSIIKTDTVSPVLGEDFVRNSFLMAFLAMIAVSVVLVIRYKKIIIAVPIILTMLSEVIILLGVAAFIGWNIDLAAIAGILAAIGTGVNDQIVITDETLRGGSLASYNWKEKIKRAFMIIMLAYLTVVVAMIPLVFAGAGLLKGFAITTIIGITAGVFITRPAYGAFVEVFLKD